MQTISLEQIYNRCIGLWPKQIGIGDGRLAAGDGHLFPELSRVHAAVEGKIDHSSDHWAAVFTWSVFQASHEYAKAAIGRGETHIEVSRIPFALIDTYVRKNLAEPEWQAERSEYVGLNSK